MTVSERAWTKGEWEALPVFYAKDTFRGKAGTPNGEWEVVIFADERMRKAKAPWFVFTVSDACADGSTEANARLAAAAPELFEALDEAVLYLAVWAATNKDEAASALLNKCTAALAKATGEAA